MRILHIAVPAVALFATLLPAQEEAPQSAQQEFRELTQAYRQAQSAYYAEFNEKVKKARDAGAASLPAFSMAPLAKEWLPKFQTGADKYKGTDDALPFLQWVYGNAQGEQKDAALATLLADHIESQAFAQTVSLIGRQARALGNERVQEILAQIIEKSPHADVQAQAFMARAQLFVGSRKEPTDEQLGAAMADFRKAAAIATDATIKGRAEGAIFEQEHLQIGKEVPDIVGNDLDGVEFKLSDYRGKVVLIDFWGDW